MKETHYKLKHRVTALFAAAVMLCSMLPGAAFAEEPTPQPTEETVQMEQQTEPSETDNGQTDESSPDPGEDVTEATPETAEEQPAEEEISAAIVGARWILCWKISIFRTSGKNCWRTAVQILWATLLITCVIVRKTIFLLPFPLKMRKSCMQR